MAKETKEKEITKDVAKNVKKEVTKKETPKKGMLNKIKNAGKKEEKVVKAIDFDPLDVLKLVLMTEKSVRSVELQNKLVFIVDRKADKTKVKQAVENAFQADVSQVNIMIDQKGRKKAFVKFAKPGIAGEVAIKLGII